jgi:hypothetical protein
LTLRQHISLQEEKKDVSLVDVSSGSRKIPDTSQHAIPSGTEKDPFLRRYFFRLREKSLTHLHRLSHQEWQK